MSSLSRLLFSCFPFCVLFFLLLSISYYVPFLFSSCYLISLSSFIISSGVNNFPSIFVLSTFSFLLFFSAMFHFLSSSRYFLHLQFPFIFHIFSSVILFFFNFSLPFLHFFLPFFLSIIFTFFTTFPPPFLNLYCFSHSFHLISSFSSNS